MKKALIITYYWPPSGGGGVMRWLKMSKYLPELDWQPIIYTPSNPDASVIDNSLVAEIHPLIKEIKTPIWEPYNVYRKLTGTKKSEKFKAGHISEASSGNWKSKLSVFIRGNLLIPDPRKFWIKPSVRFLKKYLQEEPVDLIISSGPPHSMHLIAFGLKNNFDIPWIADFRDPWTDIDFYSKLRLTNWADRKHKKLEKKVLHLADHVVTVSTGCASDIDQHGNKETVVITNGYDPEDFVDLPGELDTTFTISHFGSFNQDRNPSSLWIALKQLGEKLPKFKEKLKIQLIGQTDTQVINDIKANGLKNNLVVSDHLPHKEGLQKLAKSQVLLLPLNNAPNVKGILTGKMFEYLALKRPIFAIGPKDADYAKIIAETQSGAAHDFNDVQSMMHTLETYFDKYKQNKLQVNSASIEKYSRRNLAKKFTELVD